MRQHKLGPRPYNKVRAMNVHLAVRIFVIFLVILTFGFSVDGRQNSKKSVRIESYETVDNSEKGRQNRQLCNRIGEKVAADFEEFQHIAAAGMRWKVVFEDILAPNLLKRQIMRDIASIISRYSKYDLVEPRYDKAFNIEDCELLSIGYLDFSVSRSHYVPDSFLGKFGNVVRLAEKDYLIVSKRLVESYEEAKILRKNLKKNPD